MIVLLSLVLLQIQLRFYFPKGLRISSDAMFLLKQTLDIVLAQQKCVSKQLLAVETGYLPVIKGFLVLVQLAKHCAKLQMTLAHVPLLEQLC